MGETVMVYLEEQARAAFVPTLSLYIARFVKKNSLDFSVFGVAKFSTFPSAKNDVEIDPEIEDEVEYIGTVRLVPLATQVLRRQLKSLG